MLLSQPVSCGRERIVCQALSLEPVRESHDLGSLMWQREGFDRSCDPWPLSCDHEHIIGACDLLHLDPDWPRTSAMHRTEEFRRNDNLTCLDRPDSTSDVRVRRDLLARSASTNGMTLHCLHRLSECYFTNSRLDDCFYLAAKGHFCRVFPPNVTGKKATAGLCAVRVNVNVTIGQCAITVIMEVTTRQFIALSCTVHRTEMYRLGNNLSLPDSGGECHVLSSKPDSNLLVSVVSVILIFLSAFLVCRVIDARYQLDQEVGIAQPVVFSIEETSVPGDAQCVCSSGSSSSLLELYSQGGTVYHPHTMKTSPPLLLKWRWRVLGA